MLPIRLSDLAFTIGAVLDEAFGQKPIWVLAETSDIKNYPDRGYCFLTLVERDAANPGQTLAKLDASIWRRHYGIIRTFEQETGVAFARNIQVLVQVVVSFSATYGLRVEILNIDPSYTLGQLERERQAVLDQLLRDLPQHVTLQDGQYITTNQLLPRPLVFQRIALITAPNSDGLRDFRHELTQNPYGYAFTIDEYLTQVQGKGAEDSLREQLERIAAVEQPYDAVVLIRGGGSQLDFGPFDTYTLAEAVAPFQTPILTGIGHERNVSIADLMAHQSLKTPTKVAAFILDQNRQFEAQCLWLHQRVTDLTAEHIRLHREQLAAETERWRFVMHNYFRKTQTDLAEKAVTLRHLDPANLLRRGYALVWQNGTLVTRASDVQPTQPLTLQFSDGTVAAKPD